MSRSSEGQCHNDLSNNVCEYEVNQLTIEKVIRGKQNLNANCLISLKNLAKKLIELYKEKIFYHK